MLINSRAYFVLALMVFYNQLICTQMIMGRQLGDGNWGTHMVPLVTAVVNTQGPVLELGCGDYSTPLLHAICSFSKRKLVSSESNIQWLQLFLDMQNSWHTFIHVPSVQDWQNVGQGEHWAVVFVDHSPAKQRVIDIKRLRSVTDVFVVHDVESLHPDYGWYPYLNTFKYQYTYKRYSTQTMVLSDTINVEEFFN